MNRLNKMWCYLAGPIDFVEDLGLAWRDEISPWLEDKNINVFNPLRPMLHGSQNFDVKRPMIKKMQKDGDFDNLRLEVKNVVRWDLRAIDLSSFVIVNYDINIHQCGTMEEIFVANQQSKPVIFHVNGQKRNLPKWLYGRFPQKHMFDTWDEVKNYLHRIDTDPNFEFPEYESKRWMFFAGKHMLSDVELEEERWHANEQREMQEYEIMKAEMREEENCDVVTREMAMDAGFPEMEGMSIK